MAHYEEVLSRLREQEGVLIERKSDSIAVRFAPSISRQNLVTITADILSSEELPFNGNYNIMDINEDVLLEIWSL